MVISNKHYYRFSVIKYSEVKRSSTNIDMAESLIQNLMEDYALHSFRVQIEVVRDFHVLICIWMLAPDLLTQKKQRNSSQTINCVYFLYLYRL
jgi:hypothetical protein